MKQNIHLLLIDIQNSFIIPDTEYDGLAGGHLNLCVEGAKEDSDRTATFISKHKDKLTDIHMTLDSHHVIHIASPVFWKDQAGNHPNPFTVITADDVRKGVWQATKRSLQAKALAYVESLETNGRYVLCIWPPHCIIGTKGHAIYEPVRRAVHEWEKNFGIVDFVTKGSNPYTEHYSAVKADVIDHADPSTQLNMNLIQTLTDVDYLLIDGQALNFCLNFTVTDVANNVSADLAKKFVILEDATSPVKGFEALTDNFIADMKNRGVQFSTTTQFF